MFQKVSQTDTTWMILRRKGLVILNREKRERQREKKVADSNLQVSWDKDAT